MKNCNCLGHVIWLIGFLFLSQAEAQLNCSFARQLADRADAKIVADSVLVPEDWSNPTTSPQIEIVYYYVPRTDFDVKDPVIFINGGPNVSSQTHLEGLFGRFMNHRNNSDKSLIMFDQRGVGCSSPLKTQQEVYPLAVAKKYNSEAIARDIEVIRMKLAPKKRLHLIGHSYGTLVASRYAQLFPIHLDRIDNYGPVLHDNMKDFFKYRTLAQNDLLKVIEEKEFQWSIHKKMFNNVVYRRIDIKGNPITQGLSVKDGGPRVLGPNELIDLVFNPIGQGFLDENGGAETRTVISLLKELSQLYGMGRDDLYPLIHLARSRFQWFTGTRSYWISAIWATEFSSTGHPFKDCDLAQEEARLILGLNTVADLPLDECRLIKAGKPPALMDLLENQFRELKSKSELNWVTQAGLMNTLNDHPHIRIRLVFGEHDTIAQNRPLRPLIAHPSVEEETVPHLGHSGYIKGRRFLDSIFE